MDKFVFIILNYESTEETEKCIQAIESLSYSNKYIIVVDNDSGDQKQFFDYIIHQFCKYDNITYLQSKINGGYARGNNIGFYYAKYKLEADYICIINPDAKVESNDFIETAIKAYNSYDYAICGPSIVKNMIDINPLGGYSENKWRIFYNILEDYRIYYTKKWRLGRINLLKKSYLFKSQKNIQNSSSELLEKCNTNKLIWERRWGGGYKHR